MRLCMRGWKSQRCTSVFALRLHLSRRPSSCLTELQDLLPGIINQLGPDNLANLKKLAETYQGGQAPPGAKLAVPCAVRLSARVSVYSQRNRAGSVGAVV